MDPKALQMVQFTVCWYCYTGDHTGCVYVGHHPDHTHGVIGSDCACSRMGHPDQITLLGTSTQLHDAAGHPVHAAPLPAADTAGHCTPCLWPSAATIWT